MAEVMDYLEGVASSLYDAPLALNVLFLAVVLAIVSLFIWKFYKSVSKRNLIQLNLRQYNRSEHPLLSKLLAMVLYFLEYVIIMPLLIILWFAGLSIVLLMIAKERPINEVLLIAAILIGAIRILAYIHGEIAKDLAKLFPFITLSVFLLSPGEFNWDVVLVKVGEIPFLLSHIFSFVLVVFAVEIVLRVFYTVYEFWLSEGEEEEAVAEVAGKS